MSDEPSSDPAQSPEPSLPDRLEEPDSDGEGLNWRLVVGVVATAAILGYLVVDGLGSETYFFTVDEAVAQQSSLVDQRIRVKGNVVEGSVEHFDARVGRKFDIAEKGETLTVHAKQAMPDTFKPGVKVVATGTLEKPGRLVAEKVLVKCPSRYGDKPPTAEGKPGGPQARR